MFSAHEQRSQHFNSGSGITIMAVDFKDYYAVLGLKRDATPDEIKKAFRALARQYHPDIAKDKTTAEAKFKEINEANEVLSDPVKRKKYDELGADWESGGRAAGAPFGEKYRRWTGGAGAPEPEVHFGGTGFSDFFEQFFSGGGAGGGRAADFEEMFGPGRRSGGAAQAGGAHARRGSDIEGDILVTLDEVLHGSMRTISLQRVDPRTGEAETETFTVRIPPGAQEGRRIRVPGKGGQGSGGAESGDLFLRVRLAAHPDFEVRGADLFYTLELAPWEAVLGAQLVVPTLSGSVKLKIPPGTTQGRQLRVSHQGLPRGTGGERGDLYVVAQVEVPTTVSPAERELWEKLAHGSRFNPREKEAG